MTREAVWRILLLPQAAFEREATMKDRTENHSLTAPQPARRRWRAPAIRTLGVAGGTRKTLQTSAIIEGNQYFPPS